MKKYIFLLLILFLVSSCTIAKLPAALKNHNQIIKNNHIVEEKEIPEIKYGSVSAQDINNYYDIQTQILCGASHGSLLKQYNLTIDRLVEIGSKVDKKTLPAIINEKAKLLCPEKYVYMNPALGALDD